ncbi:hypothetical protein E2C01_079386 [Portunus trituberculatus]|uniref:Uncharacterized protein n=1 Tax=Portunus trituberculatus TaxID=210409 RepID=A0A5B7IGU2_PORTR|nr:hypothetical protein [Portunus trituberculatus]
MTQEATAVPSPDVTRLRTRVDRFALSPLGPQDANPNLSFRDPHPSALAPFLPKDLTRSGGERRGDKIGRKEDGPRDGRPPRVVCSSEM